MKNLRNLRQEQHISQQKLAEQFLLTQQSIYKYENGLAEPDIQTLIQLADYFNTSVDYLIGHTPKENPNTLQYVSPEESTHLEQYRKLSQSAKEHLDGLLKEITTK